MRIVKKLNMSLKKIHTGRRMRKAILTQKRLMIRDVIPIVRRMLYDTAREDHKSSENLKEKLGRYNLL